MSKKLIFFGAGEVCRLSIGYAATRHFEVSYISDNDSNKWGDTYKGIPIISPKELKSFMGGDYEIVITVGPKVVIKISEQLQSMGFIYGEDFVTFYDKFYCGTIPSASEPGYVLTSTDYDLVKPVTDCVLTVDKERNYVYRAVGDEKAENLRLVYERVCKSETLIKSIVKTCVLENNNTSPLVFQHEFLPLVSYCSEWSPSMFRDYVLYMIDFIAELDKIGLGIQDPSLYNATFHNGKFVYVDYSGIFWDKTNWFIMQTFIELHINTLIIILKCQSKGYMYLQNPMMVAKFADVVGYLNKQEILQYHEMFSGCEKSTVNGEVLKACEILKDYVNLLTSDFASVSDWTGYQDNLYSQKQTQKDYTRKQKEVLSLVRSVSPKTLLDLAGNMGWYSLTLSKELNYAVTIDIDTGISDSAYEILMKLNVKNVYPISLNFIAPTPALYRNVPVYTEPIHPHIKGAIDRFKCEMVLVLAVIHHLALSQGLSFEEIVGQVYLFTGRYLIIEFIDREDEWVVRYLRQYSESRTAWYTRERFEKALGEKFTITSIRSSDTATRSLYLCEKR